MADNDLNVEFVKSLRHFSKIKFVIFVETAIKDVTTIVYENDQQKEMSTKLLLVLLITSIVTTESKVSISCHFGLS